MTMYVTTHIPDPFIEIRILTLHSLRGINYWSRHPVTRMDLNVGAYEEISSADVPGFNGQLIAALPGLVEHECSIGRRGGFVDRLERGTYAGHVVEHVALELQAMIGHDTSFGRTRGTGEPGGYAIVFEHTHQMVGLRAAALALGIVQRAFVGALHSAAGAVSELRALAATPDAPPLRSRVMCGVTGSAGRAETVVALRELCDSERSRGDESDNALMIDVSPSYLLHAGLPYAMSDVAIILDATLVDIPEHYRDPECAARLVSIVADAVPPNGIVVCASDIPLVHAIVRDSGRTVHMFPASGDFAARARRAGRCAANAITETRTASIAPSANTHHTAHHAER